MSPRHVSCIVRRLPLHSLQKPARPAFVYSPAAAQCRSFRLSNPVRTSNDARPRLSGQARPSTRFGLLVAAAGLVSLAAFRSWSTSARASFTLDTSPAPDLTATCITAAPAVDARDPGLPRFRIAEIRQHGPDSDSPWVIRGDKVYDITNWVPAHPGGQVILRAAGGSIDPYWDIFTIHKNDYVYEILSQYLIGFVHPADLVDGKPAQEQIADPFAQDPSRNPALITRTSRPCNAETPAYALNAHFLTPNDLFYVRNHMWVPKVDRVASDAHILTVELDDGTSKQYTLQDLKTKFRSRKITAVMQCSGNRRKHMSQGSGRPTNGLQWSAGAISNASWEGVLLADVLADAGFDLASGLDGSSEAKHVHFAGMEAYSASIPLKKAVDPQGDVLLAYSMNNTPLPPDHGFPLRAIVPGHVAARSVKWLNHITLSDEESISQWQRRDYKCFGPNETKVDWDAAPAIQELPVQSAITHVKMGGWADAAQADSRQGGAGYSPPTPRLAAQKVCLSGYAFSGGGRSIIRVDVSLDGGRSWSQARLLPDSVDEDGSSHGHWSWKRWRFDSSAPLALFREREQRKDYPANVKSEATEAAPAGEAENDGDTGRRCTTVLVKAIDDAYNTQPETHTATWNLRGNLATAWHRIQICADCSSPATARPPAPSTESGEADA